MFCVGGSVRVEFVAPEELWQQAQDDDLRVSNRAYTELLEICPYEANRGHLAAFEAVCVSTVG